MAVGGELMGLPTAVHREALAEQKRRRNAHQRAIRQAPVHFVRVLLFGGRILLVAQSRSTLGAAYQIEQIGPDRWRCSCDGYRWRGSCAHSKAAEARTGAGSFTAAPALAGGLASGLPAAPLDRTDEKG